MLLDPVFARIRRFFEDMRRRNKLDDLIKQYPDKPEVVFKILRNEARDKLNQLEVLLNYAPWCDKDPWGDAIQLDGLCEVLNKHIMDQIAAQGKIPK
jgi:hypothetical protein